MNIFKKLENFFENNFNDYDPLSDPNIFRKIFFHAIFGGLIGHYGIIVILIGPIRQDGIYPLGICIGAYYIRALVHSLNRPAWDSLSDFKRR